MTVQELYHTGHIKLLFNRCLLSADVLAYFDYVAHYEALRGGGTTYREAVYLTANRFGVSESTIKRAVRRIMGAKS